MRRFGPLLLLLGFACAHGPSSGIGYRARAAADAQDLAAFDALLAEAASAEKERGLDPERTVLTHFLALGGHPAFRTRIEAFRAKGWIDRDMDCAIDRAERLGTSDEARALELESSILQRASAAAASEDRSWELSACLEDARFLDQAGPERTAQLAALVVDRAQPLSFRRQLLAELAERPVPSLGQLHAEHPELDREALLALQIEAARAERARFEALLDAVAEAEPPLITHATALPAVRLERLLAPYGTSLLAERPEQRWWITQLAARPPIPELRGLGIWTTGPGHWFVCGAEIRTEPDGCEHPRGPFALELSARALLPRSPP